MSDLQKQWDYGVDKMITGHQEMAAAGFDFDKRVDTSVEAMCANEVLFTSKELAFMLATAVDRLANADR